MVSIAVATKPQVFVLTVDLPFWLLLSARNLTCVSILVVAPSEFPLIQHLAAEAFDLHSHLAATFHR